MLIQNHNCAAGRHHQRAAQLAVRPTRVKLLNELRDNNDVKTIKIDAYVSPQVPAEYAADKLNLLSTLEEFRALSGGKIDVDVHEIPNFSDEAELAEKNYGITPQRADRRPTAAKQSAEEFFLGLAVTSGLDKVVMPFVDRASPSSTS